MAYKADNQQNQANQVAGMNPLGNAGMAGAQQPAQNQNNAPQSSPSSGAIQSSGQPQQQPQEAPNAPKKPASSGMFTNIQKYVQKNKPAAQKMAGAVQEDFGQKAEQIRTAAQQKQEQQQKNINVASGAVQSQLGQAQQTVNQITNVDQQFDPNKQKQGMEQFQTMFQQGPKVNEVDALNLTPETARSQALSNLAKTAERDTGRRQMLDQTFGDRTYTKGQSELDNLIMGGDVKAREDLIRGVQGEAEGIQNTIKNIEQQSAEQLSGLKGQIDSFKSDLQNMLDQGVEGLSAEAAARRQEQIQQRAAQIRQMENNYNSKLETYNNFLSNIGNLSLDQLGDFLRDKVVNSGDAGKDYQFDTVTMQQLGSRKAREEQLKQAIERGSSVRFGDVVLSPEEAESIFLQRQSNLGESIQGLAYNPETNEYIINPELIQKTGQRSPILGGALQNYTYQDLAPGLESIYSDQRLGANDYGLTPTYDDPTQRYFYGRYGESDNVRRELYDALFNEAYGALDEDLLESTLGDDFLTREEFYDKFGERRNYSDTYSVEDYQAIQDYLKNLSGRLGEEDLVNSLIQGKYGYNTQDLISGKDLLDAASGDVFRTADQDIIDRRNALMNIAGRQSDILDTSTYNRDYLESSDLSNLLKDELGEYDKERQRWARVGKYYR